MSTKDKLLMVLVAATSDSDFNCFIEEEFHILYSVINDIYSESGIEGWNDILNEILTECKDYIEVAFNELEKFY